MKEEYVIVNFASEIPKIWEYCSSENTEEKIKRYIAEEKECGKRCRNNAKNNPKDSDYWNMQADIHEKADFRCITVKEYDNILRDNLLSGEPSKISKEKYNDMYDMFPPLYLTQRNGFEMFCNTEMIISSYTMQYAHDMKNDIYYSKIVSVSDPNTWIDMIILGKRYKLP